jgi:hypothetical protein
VAALESCIKPNADLHAAVLPIHAVMLQAPLVYFFGHTSPDKQEELYRVGTVAGLLLCMFP